jgi:nucleoside-diphosphate-sugar epimerase
MKKILITGGAGYIGSMLSTKLVQLGYFVSVVDLLKYDKNSLSHLLYYDNFELIKHDVTDEKFIKNTLSKYDYIIPLAALVGAPLCEKNKKKNYQNQCRNNKNFIEIY